MLHFLQGCPKSDKKGHKTLTFVRSIIVSKRVRDYTINSVLTAFMKHIFPVLIRPRGSITGAEELFASKDTNTSMRVALPVATEPLTLCTTGLATFPASGEDLATSAQDERIGGRGTAAVLVVVLSSVLANPSFGPPVTEVDVSLDSSSSLAGCSLGAPMGDSIDPPRLVMGVSFSPLTGVLCSVLNEGVVEGGTEGT